MHGLAGIRTAPRRSPAAKITDVPILPNITLFHSTIGAIGRVRRNVCFSGRAFCGKMRSCERRPPDCSSVSRWCVWCCSRPFSRCRRNDQPLRNQIAVRKCWRARANVTAVQLIRTHRTPRQDRHVVLPSIAAWCCISQTRGPLSRTLWFSAQLAESMSTHQRENIVRLFRRRASRQSNSHWASLLVARMHLNFQQGGVMKYILLIVAIAGMLGTASATSDSPDCCGGGICCMGGGCCAE